MFCLTSRGGNIQFFTDFAEVPAAESNAFFVFLISGRGINILCEIKIHANENSLNR